MSAKRQGNPNTPFAFFRSHSGKEMFYVVNLYGDKEDIGHNVRANPGTIRVEDMKGNIVWPPH